MLSLPVFEIFSRLSYGMYLVHYAVIQLRYLSTRSSIEFGIMDQVNDDILILCGLNCVSFRT